MPGGTYDKVRMPGGTFDKARMPGSTIDKAKFPVSTIDKDLNIDIQPVVNALKLTNKR